MISPGQFKIYTVLRNAIISKDATLHSNNYVELVSLLGKAVRRVQYQYQSLIAQNALVFDDMYRLYSFGR